MPRIADQNVARIERALDSTIAVDCRDVPLEQAIRSLVEQVAVPVVFDRGALQEEPVSLDAPVSIQVPALTLRSALQLLLEPHHLAALIENESLLITTTSRAADRLEPQIYDVTDLVAHLGRRTRAGDEFRALIEMVESVAPDTWERLGRPGSCSGLVAGKSRLLLVRQTQAVQRDVARLLADLRLARQLRGNHPDRPIRVSADQSPAARREAEIRRALDRPVSLTGEARPWQDVVAEIARQVEIPVVFDSENLSAEQIPADLHAGIHLDGVSARAALVLILEPLTATCLIRNEVLLVTTRPRADDLVQMQVYEVSQVVTWDRDAQGRMIAALNPLKDLIMRNIAPDWDWGNGPGILRHLRWDGTLVLGFEATPQIHDEVERFLTELREMRRAHDPDLEPTGGATSSDTECQPVPP